ncbi:MAG TPA: acyl-CoA desaturase [Baekduia sp.]|nr:acyl-CoA desaturase [Baekduia sp.]
MPPAPLDHLTPDDLDAIGCELDDIRDELMASLGAEDAAYIRKVIAAQRGLEAGGRAALLVSLFPPAWLAGTTLLAVAKILENMELGHNILHGQWDWMRDPEIHSTTWEWDIVSPAEGWKKSHNFEHHTFTNVVGKDRDLGYTLLRIDPEQPWRPVCLLQPFYNVILALGFQWGVALFDLEVDEARKGRKSWRSVGSDALRLGRKASRQIVKDYVVWPLLSGPSAVPALLGNATANLARNVWTHSVIFCGHFPDGAETFDFDEADLDEESRGGWYVRQLLGSCNIDGTPLLHLMTGNLSYQIEHHLFPDLPSNRYAQIAPRVRTLCERYGLPYVSGPMHRQYGQVLRKIVRMSLPGGAPAPALPDVELEAAEPLALAA